MIGKGEIAKFGPCLPQILECADGNFTWADVYKKILEFGWEIEDIDAEFKWGNFRPEEELRVTVDMSNGAWGNCIFMPVYYWDYADYGDDQTLYETQGRKDYEAAYKKAVTTAKTALGVPKGTGVWETDWHQDADYKYTWWQRGNTRVIVQQAELDIQFGPDVNVWLYRCEPGEPMLPTPSWAEATGTELSPTGDAGSQGAFWETMYNSARGEHSQDN